MTEYRYVDIELCGLRLAGCVVGLFDREPYDMEVGVKSRGVMDYCKKLVYPIPWKRLPIYQNLDIYGEIPLDWEFAGDTIMCKSPPDFYGLNAYTAWEMIDQINPILEAGAVLPDATMYRQSIVNEYAPLGYQGRTEMLRKRYRIYFDQFQDNWYDESDFLWQLHFETPFVRVSRRYEKYAVSWMFDEFKPWPTFEQFECYNVPAILPVAKGPTRETNYFIYTRFGPFKESWLNFERESGIPAQGSGEYSELYTGWQKIVLKVGKAEGCPFVRVGVEDLRPGAYMGIYDPARMLFIGPAIPLPLPPVLVP